MIMLHSALLSWIKEFKMAGYIFPATAFHESVHWTQNSRIGHMDPASEFLGIKCSTGSSWRIFIPVSQTDPISCVILYQCGWPIQLGQLDWLIFLREVSVKAFMPTKKLFTVVWLSIERWRDQMNALLKVSPFGIFFQWKNLRKKSLPKITSSQR